MDEVQELIDELTPSLKAMAAKVEATRTEQPYIAGYIDQYLSVLVGALEGALFHANRYVDTVRRALPASALAKERMGQQQALQINAEQANKIADAPYVPWADRMFAERVQELQNLKHTPVMAMQGTLGSSSVSVAEVSDNFVYDDDMNES